MTAQPPMPPAAVHAAPASFMARALALAAIGRYSTFPNPRVGAVVVSDGRIVGEGWHARAGEPHAEVHALRAAGAAAKGADLYVTLEPCSHHGRTPPCADAVVDAGIRKVWVAMGDPNPLVAGRGLQRLRANGIMVESGLLEPAARLLNRGFVTRMTRGRPLVTLKLGASLDGRTAMASGESRWITGEASRADVHRLRAEAGAVLTSSQTVLADDPALTVRTPLDGEPPARGPDRIVIDASGRVAASAKVWADDGARCFRIARADCSAPPSAVADVRVAGTPDGQVDLAAALAALAGHEVNHVLVECGPGLAGALLRRGLVDELVVYLAPSLLGSDARGLVGLPGLERLADRIALSFTDVRKIGDDLRVTAVPVPPSP